MPGKALVINANILVRAFLGRRVREIIETYAEQASFFVPMWLRGPLIFNVTPISEFRRWANFEVSLPANTVPEQQRRNKITEL